jgi:hypothetical protein
MQIQELLLFVVHETCRNVVPTKMLCGTHSTTPGGCPEVWRFKWSTRLLLSLELVGLHTKSYGTLYSEVDQIWT